jgi:hypothetical protein
MTFSLNPPWDPFYHPDTSVDGIGLGAIPYFMTRPMNDSRYMPVTRDLSDNRKQTVLNYVKILQKEHSS